MLPCYVLSEKLLVQVRKTGGKKTAGEEATGGETEVADVYVCTRDKCETLLEKYKVAPSRKLTQLLQESAKAGDRFKAAVSRKPIAISVEPSKPAYLWIIESLQNQWLWAELPALLLDVAEQQIFRIVEPREKLARAKALLAWGLATYKFDKFRSLAKSKPPRLLIDDGNDAEPRSQTKRAEIVCAEIICDGRDLINTPANILGVQGLEQVVRELAEDSGGEFNSVIGEELLQQKYPLIHAVGKSAREAPRLLDVRWNARKNSANKNPICKDSTREKKSLTIVGKGVCFDSGGLNIKPASAMLLMKKDMGGAAHAICLARLLLASNCPIELRLLLPLAENAVSRDAMRPLDIYPSRKGDTVEIGHTDAEGRLLLADALWEASQPQRDKKGEMIESNSRSSSPAPSPPDIAPPDLVPPDLVSPDLIIDFATLTGAARVATGPRIPNLFTNSDSLAATAARIAQELQDPLWRMPLWLEYRSVLYSRCADISSASPWGYAGAITAALFLQNFLAEDIPWMHIDTMAWNEKNTAGRPEGGEIQAVRTIAKLVEQWSRDELLL